MPRLTVEVITESEQYVNAVKDRELNLRAKKIPAIENLGATLDQFDTIDFSDNDICRLDGFPLLKRLKTLILNNNRICRFAEDLNLSLPNLDTIILTNNTMQELVCIEFMIFNDRNTNE
ncbi:U2 small nuclear ribonucleoprotein A' [Oopsacas minuta]|uniref:U2 small nuclear ribonucleoprotein A n=1 Tax=Oopsacas minuta TaxID=111878 RepID=A0AAV7K8B9_9METZ|nr:U2 small nuclear ribonucleoprotein A' [Oopsacas minuta]